MEEEIKYTSLDPAFVSAHQSRISAFIEHHDDEVDKERYKRKLRIKSMKRPHLSNDVLHQMYGANRYKEMGASEKTENPPPLRRHLGPVTGFGDGNGSFWDRWLVKEPPPKSSFAKGDAYPLRGYKRLHPDRYQVYEKPRHDPNGQHIVHDLAELVKMFPDNPFVSHQREKELAAEMAAKWTKFRDKRAMDHAGDRGVARAKSKLTPTSLLNTKFKPKSDGSGLKTKAACDALAKFEERVRKSTRTLASSCVLVDPLLPPME